MEQVVATLSQITPEVNSLIKPVIISDVVLLRPGIWTGTDGQKTRYSAEGVRSGFLNTNWEGMNLFLDHRDANGPAAAYWIGFIKNARMVGEELYGDLEIWHPLFAMFIKTAKAKFGVSMTMNGTEDFNADSDYSDFDIRSYQSGSLVDEPGCEASWLPKMLGKGDKDCKTVTAGNVSLQNIKSLSNSNNNSSKKNLASGDAEVSDSSDSEKHSEEEDNYKEVKKMKDKVNQEANTEGQKEVVESKDEVKSESKEEVKSESSTEAENNEVKQLSAKVDKLSSAIESLTGIVQKSLAAGEKVKEEVKEEVKEDVKSEKTETNTEEEAESNDDELESTKAELEETKKELAVAKAELNEPDQKSLAAGYNSVSSTDSNAGMLGFLKSNAHLD